MADPQTRSLPLGVLLVLAAAAAYLLGLLLWPFLPAIVTSAVAAALSYPVHVRVSRRVGVPSLAALITTSFVFFLVLLPAAGLSVVLVGEIRSGLDALASLVSGAAGPGGALTRWWERIAEYLGLQHVGFGDTVTEQARAFVALLARRTLRFLSGLGGWLLQAGAALFTLYYLLRDGEALLDVLRWLIPLEPDLTARLIEQARDVIYATVYGNVVVAIVQGGLGGLAFLALGLPAAALWGSVMAALSLLPVVGAFLVWGPAGLILLASGSLVRGLILLIFGAVVISTVDNYLRAVLVAGRAQLHPLAVFFSVLGGLLLFGAVGIFVGPVMFVVALSLIEMARVALEPGERPTEAVRETLAHPRHFPLTGRLFSPGTEKGARSGEGSEAS